MGRGRAANYDEQRDRIRAEAARLFAQRGYPATSMNDVAQACGLSKATLYHYYSDKTALLAGITLDHVAQLQAIVAEVLAMELPPEPQLRTLIQRLLRAYAGAQDAHRVLTEDVRFLSDDDRKRVVDQERAVVAGFTTAVLALRPDLQGTAMGKPLTMLLFGMINWLFTWMKPDGAMDHDDVASLVQELFLGGLPAVRPLQGGSKEARKPALDKDG